MTTARNEALVGQPEELSSSHHELEGIEHETSDEVAEDLNGLKTEAERDVQEDIDSKLYDDLSVAEGHLWGIMDEVRALPDHKIENEQVLKDYIKNKNVLGAVTEFFGILGRFLAGSSNDTGLDEYSFLDEKIENFLGALSNSQLHTMQNELDVQISHTDDLHKKMSFLYVLSALKDEYEKRHKEDISGFDLLRPQLEPGTVLLLNKQASGIWVDPLWKLMRSADAGKYPTVFTHSIIITKVEQDRIFFAHSGWKTTGWMGIEEAELEPYLATYPSADVMVMKMTPERARTAVDVATETVAQNPEYDYGAAVGETFDWNDIVDEKYNCAEFVAHAIGLDGMRNLAKPTDFLHEDMLKPVYLGTLTS